MDLDLQLVAEGLEFPEGPVVMADGSVVLVEIKARRITRVSPDGAKTTVAEPGGGPNGLAIGPDGALYVCNNGGRFTWHEVDGVTIPGPPPKEHAGGSIQRIDLASGSVTTLYEACDGRRLLAPNDLMFAADGSFWFSDHGWGDHEGTRHGGLFWAKADGSKIVRAATLPTPNGVGLSPDGTVVYAADTMSGRLWAFDIVGEGQVAPGPMAAMPGRLVVTMPGFQLFDSLAMEADGRICVATLINGCISAITPEGEVEQYPVPDLLPTNIAFGGADMRDAWITASGRGKLYKTRWPRPGVKAGVQRLADRCMGWSEAGGRTSRSTHAREEYAVADESDADRDRHGAALLALLGAVGDGVVVLLEEPVGQVIVMVPSLRLRPFEAQARC